MNGRWAVVVMGAKTGMVVGSAAKSTLQVKLVLPTLSPVIEYSADRGNKEMVSHQFIQRRLWKFPKPSPFKLPFKLQARADSLLSHQKKTVTP